MITSPPSEAYPDLWHYLAATTGRPVVLYGMGNGADKIIAVLDRYGVPVADVFASDGFVRGHRFHGMTVLSYSAMMEKYRDTPPIVLLSFASSRPEVLETIERVADSCELYAPDVPVTGEALFDAAFVAAHAPEIAAARALFADEESRQVFDGIIRYKLTGHIPYLRATESGEEEAMTRLLPTATFTHTLDLGAYTGDSIRALRPYAPHLTHVIAMEPDPRNHRKLEGYARSLAEAGDICRVEPVAAGAWSEDTTLTFHQSGNRNACLSDAYLAADPHATTADNPHFGKTRTVDVRTADGVVAALWGANTPVDFIKYDVEGAEARALEGSHNLITRYAPSLLVSAYHRSEDLFSLPLLLHGLRPDYRLYLRRMAGIPAWDINLYAVTDRRS